MVNGDVVSTSTFTMPAREQLGLQQVRDHARIVQRPALPAVFAEVKPLVEVEPAMHHLAHPGAKGPDRLQPAAA